MILEVGGLIEDHYTSLTPLGVPQGFLTDTHPIHNHATSAVSPSIKPLATEQNNLPIQVDFSQYFVI